jgi:hypothetical protein
MYFPKKGRREIMSELHQNLTDEERKRNEYLDSINQEPWPIIFFIAIVLLFCFTTLIIIGTF